MTIFFKIFIWDAKFSHLLQNIELGIGTLVKLESPVFQNRGKQKKFTEFGKKTEFHRKHDF